MSPTRETRAWRRFLEAYEDAMARWPSDRHAHTVPTPAGTTQAYSCGQAEGPAVVLLHGAAATSAMWCHLAPALAPRFRVVSLDIVSDVGRSVPARFGGTPQEFADWLCEVMDAFGIDRAHVVGASLGGWVSMEWALRCPVRVGRVVLLGPAFTFGYPTFAQVPRVLPSMLLPVPRFSRYFLNWTRTTPFDEGDPMLTLLVRALAIRRGRGSIGKLRVFTDDELRQVESEVLLLYGEDERLFHRPRAVERADRLLRNVRTATVAGAGHMVTIERPDDVAEHVLGFLQ